MTVSELRVRLETFRVQLEQHAQLWRRSLDDAFPEYPINNGPLLRQQSNDLARQLGRLRPYIDGFGFPSEMQAGVGAAWDIYDSAVSLDVAIRKGHSIENVLMQLQQILGRMDGMDPDSRVLSQGGSVEAAPNKTASAHGSPAQQGPLIFISHSSKDEALAQALVELLQSGLGIPASQIRCSSVDGYRLPVGVNTESHLRVEVNSARVLIGLITPSSLLSSFVMFELGARWGASLFLAPLVAGLKAGELGGPLSLLNGLSANNDAHLHQLLGDLSNKLEIPLQNASSYVRRISAVKELADRVASNAVQTAAPQKAAKPEIKQVGAANFYFVGEKGPYCQPCYDDKRKLVFLTPPQNWGGGIRRKCEVCGRFFYEKPQEDLTPGFAVV
jgi:hypothetical protein